MQMPKAPKNWCFTLNEKDKGGLPHPDDLLRVLVSDVKVLFTQFQEEKGAEGGTRHFQGFFSCEYGILFGTLKRKFVGVGLGSVHLEPCRGSGNDNLRYTSKEDSRVAGPWKAGTFVDFEDSRGSRGVRRSKMQKLGYARRETTGRHVVICCGPPRIGKTTIWRTICEYIHPDVYFVPAKAKNSSARWVGEYAGERTAIIDEFQYGHFEIDQWKMLMDTHDHNVAASMGGKSVLWQPEVLVLLTNNSFEYVVRHFVDKPALKSRLDEIIDWTNAPPLVMYQKTLVVYAVSACVQASPVLGETPIVPSVVTEES